MWSPIAESITTFIIARGYRPSRTLREQPVSVLDYPYHGKALIITNHSAASPNLTNLFNAYLSVMLLGLFVQSRCCLSAEYIDLYLSQGIVPVTGHGTADKEELSSIHSAGYIPICSPWNTTYHSMIMLTHLLSCSSV